MSEEETDSIPEDPVKAIRPVLIVSKHTIDDYPLLIKHLLAGFTDESIPAAMVCPPHCDVDAIATPTAQVIRHPLLKLPLMGSQNRKALVESLNDFKPTVIHALCPGESHLARQLAHDLALPYLLNVNSLQKKFRQLSLSQRRLAKIIVPSDSIKANFIANHPKYADRILRINIGTFLGPRRQFPAAGVRPVCMITAHPVRHAGDFETLLNAVRHLAIDGYEIMLLIASGGRDEKRLRKLIKSLELGHVVTLVGRLRPWRSVVAAADIFIQPRPTNSFNPLLLEAMSVGTAVAGCTGGIDELIIDGQTAIVFDPADELSVYDKLRQLLDRPELAAELAAKAQKHLGKNYSVSNMISATLAAYSEAQDWFDGAVTSATEDHSPSVSA